MEPNEIEINDEDDPVEMAVRIFNGTPSSRKLWRRYLHALYEHYHSIDDAQSFFSECLYVARSEIVHDRIPDQTPPRRGYPATNHIHAKYFTNYLKRFLPSNQQRKQNHDD